MAVSNQEVAAYLAANPSLTDAQIVKEAAKAGVTPEQLSQVMGIPEGQLVSRIAATLPPGQNVNLGGTWVQPVYDSTGQGETFEQGPLKEVMVYKENQKTGDAYKQYAPTGEYIKSGQFKDTGNFGDLLKDMGTAIGPIALMALTAGGAGGMLGSSLGLSGTAANVAGGALLGGGGAALTGQDVLKGALLGGAGGYVSGSGMFSGDTGAGNGAWLGDTETLNAVDALNGVGNGAWLGDFDTLNAVDALNGAGSNSGYYNEITGEFVKDSLGGLQGALDNTSGTNIGSMNGYTYDAGTQTWTDPTGATTTALTGVTNGAVTGQDLLNSAGAGTSTGLTASQIANLVKAGVSLTSLVGAGKVVAGDGGGGTTFTSPTQGMPSNSADYYTQLQQYYNAYMPQNPRDVVTPLQQWYEGTYNPTASIPGLPATTVPNTSALAPASVAKPATVAAVTAPSAINNALVNDASYRDTVQTVASTATPIQKAEWYNSMTNSGYNDADIRALVESSVGPQTSTDWSYLQQLAANPTPPEATPSLFNNALANDTTYRDTVQTVAASATPAQKAEWYNSMIGSGYSDADVKALVDSSVGKQSSSDWAYLQQLAASL